MVYFIAKIWRYVVLILFCDFIYIEFITPAFLKSIKVRFCASKRK